ncbi:MSCRAMM family protein [Clostridium tarantellae]|uniref:Carboxypeptidase regulatory-like domain-containing protein n=1 Tax=Clostridium tarantellae TaxID=39493 RepID=A0A6I1MLU5_9CLOT|nr:carboxypeptidase-like regulatory domain-containing protein [Clostridium tarantellae]MPQ43202.1 hypothetical protein [Clostridium tarantellae]
MQIKQDKYSLGQSDNITISGKGEDVRLDVKLNLSVAKPPIGASISGTIIDSQGNPLEGAVIKLMDKDLKSISHTVTDTQGNYMINNIQGNTVYTLVAIAAGKLLNETESFTINTNESKNIDFTLINDPNIILGAISGSLTENISSEPLAGSIVSLYSLINENPTLIAMTYTDNTGSFIFSEVSPGDYNITFTSLGFIPTKQIIKVSANKISSVNVSLSNDPLSSNGIVSGIITDTFNKKIAGADVLLYKVDEENGLIPVAFTSTSSSGIYTFINVPQGTYLVKSNQSQLITVANS